MSGALVSQQIVGRVVEQAVHGSLTGGRGASAADIVRRELDLPPDTSDSDALTAMFQPYVDMAEDAADAAAAYAPYQIATEDWFYAWTDSDLQPLWGMNRSGAWVVPGLKVYGTAEFLGEVSMGLATGLPVMAPRLDDWETVTLDSELRVVSGTKKDGTEWAASGGLLLELNPSGADGRATYDFNYTTGGHLLADDDVDMMILVIGQSWALGVNTDGSDTSATPTAEHAGYALMFNSGVRPAGGAATSYVDLHESVVGDIKETPCSGIADQIMRACNTRFGRKPRIVFAVAAKGGTSYSGIGQSATDGIKRGSAQHAEALRLVSAAKSISGSSGRRVVVAAICLAHGEEDHSAGTKTWEYARALDLLQQTYSDDIRGITGQADGVTLYTYQTNRGSSTAGTVAEVGRAQVETPQRNPRVRCVGPVYWGAAATGDTAHLTARSYRRIGQQFGRFIVDDLWGPWREPLRPVAAWWVSSTVFRLRFPAPVALETDDSKVTISTLGNGLGIDVHDGASALTVSSVTVVSGATDTLEVTISAAPTGKRPRAFIACKTTGSSCGKVTGARSGIRAATSYDTDPNDSAALYDWACVAVVDLPPQF